MKLSSLILTLSFFIGSLTYAQTRPESSIWKQDQHNNKKNLYETHNGLGQFYYVGAALRRAKRFQINPKKSKGLVLCFHGASGSAKAWAIKPQNKRFVQTLEANGYDILCPSSIGKKWDSRKGSKDLKRIEKLMKSLRETKGDIYLVGHSNGGGFASFFSRFFSQRSRIKGIQYVNSSGIPQILRDRSYQFSTIIVGARCDKVVPFKKLRNSYDILTNKGFIGKRLSLVDLTLNYRTARSKTCHEFLDSSHYFLTQFEYYRFRDRQRR